MIFTGKGVSVENLNIEVNYIIHEFLVEGAITLLYAPPKNSKSGLSMGIVKHLITQTNLRPYYFDFDNPLIALKDRKLDKFIDTYKSKFDYLHQDIVAMEGKEALIEMVNECKENPSAYKKCVLFFDSASDFCDEMIDSSVKNFMNRLKVLRNAGATIVLLHHTNKRTGEYKGSTFFKSMSDNVFSLTSEIVNKDEDNILLESIAARFGNIRHAAFKLKKYVFNLERLVYDDMCMPYHVREFIREVKIALKKAKAPINQTKLLEAIGKDKRDKTSCELLTEYSGRYWEFKEKGKSKLYSLK